MKNKLSKIFLLITIVTIVLLSVILIGCPATTKTGDTTTTTTIIAWSGTYIGSDSGTLSINQLPNNNVVGSSSSTSTKGNTANFSGTSTITGSFFSSTLSGVSSSSINSTNVNIILTINGTISGSSMTGYYTTSTNNAVSDSGTFTLTKQ